ncbi:MAG: hypothetical protein VYA60_07830 [Pseudomonadota bacterium]|nr:hypothetical protein [Pseudomonadota bacterium]
MSQSVKTPLKAYKVGMTIVRVAVNNMCDHHGGYVGRLSMVSVSHAISTAAFEVGHLNTPWTIEESDENARSWYGSKKYDVMQIMKGIVKNGGGDSVLQLLFDEIHAYGHSLNMDLLAEIVISGYTPNNCTSKQLSEYRKASSIIGKAAARLVLKEFEDNFFKNDDSKYAYVREQI